MNKLIPLIFILTSTLFNTSCNEKSAIEKYNCKIIKTESLRTIKKETQIQIPKQLKEQQLKEIAMEIKQANSNYERLFIFYFLPNTDVAWATTHFNPNLEININGATETEEEVMKSVLLPKGEIVGKWYDKSPYVEHSIIIYKTKNIYRMKETYKSDGSVGEKELKKSTKNGKIRFDYVNDFGEYLLLESDGRLGQYGNNGLISKADKIL